MVPQLVDPPYSFFDLADKYGSIKPLKRALSILRRNQVRTLFTTHSEFVPASYLADEDEPEAFEIATNNKTKVTKVFVDVLTFFNEPYTDMAQIPTDGRSILGQITLKGYETDQKTIWKVKSTILKPENDGELYICAYGLHGVSVGAATATIEAASHCQQTRYTNCCAHAAIRSALTSLPQATIQVPEHREINKLLGIDHSSRHAWQGLRVNEIEKILIGAKTLPFLYDFSAPNAKLTFEHIAYLGIESGYPVILGFTPPKQTEGHVVTVVGHTFNSHNWLAEAVVDYSMEIGKSNLGYLPSSAWMDNLVLQDDNYGPYYCLPVAYLRDMNPQVIIVTNLESTECFADEAEILAVGILPSLLHTPSPWVKWTDILFGHINCKRVIVRTTLAQKASYLTELQERKVYPEPTIDNFYDLLGQLLPRQFWITEVSVPELFTANRAKVGEIVVDPIKREVILVRLPNMFQFPDLSTGVVTVIPTNDRGYVPLRRITRCTRCSHPAT